MLRLDAPSLKRKDRFQFYGNQVRPKNAAAPAWEQQGHNIFAASRRYRHEEDALRCLYY